MWKGQLRLLLLWICGVVGIGACLGLITQSGMGLWYDSLQKSALTPPPVVFAVVWPILYMMIGVTGWLLWAGRIHALKKLFIAQLLLNWSWTPLFFYGHAVTAALLCLVLLSVVCLIFLWRSWHIARPACLWMIPYVLWVLFATYLNAIIWVS